jgi:L-aspartate oxidase
VIVRHGEETILLPTGAVILATGGVGGLWQSTTNPVGARGAGVALAARAGAILSDLEFMQFHPTALAVGADPMPLISEAVRGEGAILVDAEGKPFMAGTPGGDLAPRDIVARAVFAQWAKGGSAALDVRHFPAGSFAARFPNINRVLAEYGLDPERTPIPVRPAAHYHMGGVKAEVSGKTSVAGLWAAGEVACTGLHGANRLASNSLLEAAVCGRLAGEEAAGILTRSVGVPRADEPAMPSDGSEYIAAVRELMNRDVGVVRDGAGLVRAVEMLDDLRVKTAGTTAEDNVAIASLIAQAALRRTESRGAHFRSDAGPQVAAAHSLSRWGDIWSGCGENRTAATSPTSDQRPAAVDAQDLARAVSLAHQIEIGLSDLIDLADMADRQAFAHLAIERGTLRLRHVRPERGLHHAGRYDIDPDRREFDRQCTGQPFHRRTD